MKIKLTLLPEEALALAHYLDACGLAVKLAVPHEPHLQRGLEYVAGTLRHSLAVAGYPTPAPTITGAVCQGCGKGGALRTRQGELYHVHCAPPLDRLTS